MSWFHCQKSQSMEEKHEKWKYLRANTFQKDQKAGAAKPHCLMFAKYKLQLKLRQKEREEKWDNYDIICLSDLNSDDECITE